MAAETGKRWFQRVTQGSFALDLESGVFFLGRPARALRQAAAAAALGRR